MTTDLVAHRSSVPLMPSVQEWAMIKEQATVLVNSGFLPKDINTPEKAIAIALKGREMGIPMMQAFAHISIINGKPCISAELMLLQIRKNVPFVKVEFLQMTDRVCSLRVKRPGEAWQDFAFTWADAEKAQLPGKDSWRKYPRAMLRSRCISEMARACYPDAIAGCSYTPEEMGALVDEDGQVIEDTSGALRTAALNAKPVASEPTPPPKEATLPPTTNTTGTASSAEDTTTAPTSKAPDWSNPAIFNYRRGADMDWLKIQPDIQMMDPTTQKKIALELHGHDRSTLEEAIKRVEAAFIAEIKAEESATL